MHNKINVAALQSDSASLLGCSTATLRQRVEPRHRKLNLGITSKPTRVRMRDLAGVRLAPSSDTKLKPMKNKNRKLSVRAVLQPAQELRLLTMYEKKKNWL